MHVLAADGIEHRQEVHLVKVGRTKVHHAVTKRLGDVAEACVVRVAQSQHSHIDAAELSFLLRFSPARSNQALTDDKGCHARTNILTHMHPLTLCSVSTQ